MLCPVKEGLLNKFFNSCTGLVFKVQSHRSKKLYLTLVYTNFRPVQPLALNQDYHKIFRTVFIHVINKTSVFVYFFEKLTLFIVSHINPPHTHTHSRAPRNRFLYFIKPQNTTLYIYIPNLKWNSDKPNAAVYVRHTEQTALQQQQKKNKSGWRKRLKRWVTAVTIWVRSPIVTKEFFFLLGK